MAVIWLLLQLQKQQIILRLRLQYAPVTHWKFYDTIYTERFMQTPELNPQVMKKVQ
jgi:dipeptidyl-peptidase 4